MSVMLLTMFAAVVVGLVVKEFGRRESTICALIATALTVAYFFHPAYMT